MGALAIAGGALLVVVAFADLVNTLVTTSTSHGRFWPSRLIAFRSFAVLRLAVRRRPETSRFRELALAAYGPLFLIMLLISWVAAQIVGFGLIWWGVHGIEGVENVLDGIYYSGVVYFTVGFGEVLPAGGTARIGALAEAFAGVITVALVIGYLPTLYSAYSDRERKLMTLDDGSNGRITPTNLVKAWAPDADPQRLNAKLGEWEEWAASMLETHSTLPLLRFFRSHDPRQHWVTALGLLCDVAIHAQLIVGSSGHRESYWFLRRAIALFDEMTAGIDLSAYADAAMGPGGAEGERLLRDLYEQLGDHGFNLLPWDEAVERARTIRDRWAPQMECLIEVQLCPRGFWVHDVGIQLTDV